MKTSFKIAIAAVVGFIVGSAAGFFFQRACITDGSAKGDIAKVSKFSKNVVSPSMSAFQEKITSDPDELKKATVSLTILTSRMAEFDELVSLASIVSDGNEALASSLQKLQNAKKLASNARENGVQALDALNAIAEGKKTPIDYEQASQNLSLSYMLVDRQMTIGKQYVSEVDAYLRGKNVEDYKDLAFVRDLWAGYCAGEAVLNSDKEELEYWRNQQNLLSEGTSTLSMAEAGITLVDSYNFAPLQECLTIDAVLGLFDSSIETIKSESLNALEASGSQAFIMSNQESFHAFLFSDVYDFRNALNQVTGTGTVDVTPDRMLQNINPSMDGVITVSSVDGPMPQTREHILL